MISVIVAYQVKPAYAEQNKQHIQRFLNDFKELDSSAFQYSVYTKEDQVSFVHHSIYKNEQVQTEVLNVPSFQEFQRLRDESGLNGTHTIEFLTLVGSTDENLI
ncbi:MAG: hypothetical protein ABL872_04560 [Lacibacter sp.]